nr:copia protein [Tanacetum cinerariifolium]
GNVLHSTVNAASNEVNAVSKKSNIKLPDDPDMPELEDISIFEDLNEDVFGTKADLNNLQSTFQVFKNKLDKRRIVIRNKARLVAQGHTQEKGIDYDEVFSPVVRIEAIRLFLAYASFKDFVVYQTDVKSAFIYEKIKEEVYVCQPLKLEDPDFPNKVYKIKKELYRLHQAPRAWYKTLSTYLLDNGFQRGKIDKTLFVRRHKLMLLGKLTTPRVNAVQGSLVRDTTTASSLEAEHDSGNIDKTQTKVASNEPSSQGTSLGDGPRRQDTMGDTSAHTRLISSSNDEALYKEDTSKQGKIDEIDVDKDIALVSTHDNVSTQDNIVQYEGIKDIGEEEVIKVVTTAKMIIDTVVNAAQVTTAIADIPVSAAKTIVTTAPTITAESTKINVEVTQAHKRKGVMIQEPEETITTKIASLQQHQVQDKGKGKAKLIKELEMPKKRKHQIRADKELAKKLQAEMIELVVEGSKKDEVTEGSLKRTGEELEEENAKKQKIEDDKESTELKQCLEIIPDDGDNVTINATPLSSKSPTIVDHKIYKEGKKNYF